MHEIVQLSRSKNKNLNWQNNIDNIFLTCESAGAIACACSPRVVLLMVVICARSVWTSGNTSDCARKLGQSPYPFDVTMEIRPLVLPSETKSWLRSGQSFEVQVATSICAVRQCKPGLLWSYMSPFDRYIGAGKFKRDVTSSRTSTHAGELISVHGRFVGKWCRALNV